MKSNFYKLRTTRNFYSYYYHYHYFFFNTENNHPPIPIMRRVWCYPIQFSTPCPRLPNIEFLQEREQALLRYHGDPLAINISHLQKLVCFIRTNPSLPKKKN